MGAMCKNDTDKLTLRIQCQGPISGMLVTADANGHVKDMSANRRLCFLQTMSQRLWISVS